MSFSRFPNQNSTARKSPKVNVGIIMLVIGILMFFSSVLIPVFTRNVFLIFPFFILAFILLVIGMILLSFGRFKQFSSFSKSELPTKYDPAYENNLNVNPTQNRDFSNNFDSKVESICSYCGESNQIGAKFCKNCNSPLK
ncbi:zinc-ribbon domain-containing protein [Candidatus Harpocratesius sp.]